MEGQPGTGDDLAQAPSPRRLRSGPAGPILDELAFDASPIARLAASPDTAIGGADYLRLVGVPTAQGRRSTVALSDECVGVDQALVEGFELPVADLDTDPATFTIDSTGLGLGSWAVNVDCGQGTIAGFTLFVFRQNGAERGGADSVVVVTSLGLGSLLALAALPVLLDDELLLLVTRRRDLAHQRPQGA